MRVVVIDSFGGPEQLHERQLPVPSPDPGQVLIRLEAAGVGSWDPFDGPPFSVTTIGFRGAR